MRASHMNDVIHASISDRRLVRACGSTVLRYWDLIPFLSIHLMSLWAFHTGIRLEWIVLAVVS